ncbi:MAG: MotA/TolQ/ExbB proton channel family protein [Lentisphaerae bacterium]|nr:MotA/TolQ/ExbB proton channel family protein [Lentisphaerota bacterium]MCP4101447.1 MotA/TolQ/ExbB proton channel family protein [Lentisphaerota bacterium]
MLFFKLMKDGGPVMWIILGCSFVAMFVFIEKWFQFHREQINVKELVKGLTNVLKRDGFIEAISLCDNTPGPAARLLAASILAYERGSDDLRQAIEDANLVEIPRLERHLNLLATVGYVAPLLGLLGTVLGMMEAFQTIHAKTVYLSVAELSGSISMALITTAGGLCVAIPCYVGFNYLIARLNSITLDMEKASSEIINFFEHHKPELSKPKSTVEEL